MAWLILFVAVAAILGGLMLLGKLPRAAWEFTGAALFIGIAGYAWQGSPAEPGSPRAPSEDVDAAAVANVDQRQAISGQFTGAQRWLALADSQSRQGNYQAAAAVLSSGLRSNPENGELWLALAIALTDHSEGQITPAAQFAFQKAANINPNAPGPPFFFGLSLAQTGRLAEARSVWAELLARAPENAEWRPDLESRIAQIDRALGGPPAVQPDLPAETDPQPTG